MFNLSSKFNRSFTVNLENEFRNEVFKFDTPSSWDLISGNYWISSSSLLFNLASFWLVKPEKLSKSGSF